jgi:acetyltransferase-like isoleucine patch superfamily enzyme
MLLTSTHEMASAAHRAGPITRAPLHVGDGAWLGARCILLPGVTIGAGAIVDVGSVVTRDVAPNTRVAGTPAIVVEDLANPSSK